MSTPDPPENEAEPTPPQVNELFESLELATAVDVEDLQSFLDHLPVAIVVSKAVGGGERIVYANKAYEDLTGEAVADIRRHGWAHLKSFSLEDESHLPLSEALLKGEDFLGTFKREQPKAMLVEAYAGLIENEDSAKSYRVIALIDVTERERGQREDFERQIREKDLILKELQHRVKNNLQLVIALIRLETRSERRGDKINLDRLAGRIESLQLLYQAISPDSWGSDIELGHYLSQIASAVMNTYGVDGIRLDLKIDHAVASINIAMPLGLLVNELVTNAYKHAFTGRGTGVITVQCLRTSDDRYRVIVGDDGVGLPPGVGWPVRDKIGALIVQTLRENTHTDVAVESAAHKGTRVSIEIVCKAVPRKLN